MPHPSLQRGFLQRMAAASLLIWLLLSVAALTGRIISSYNRLPEIDYWEIVSHIDAYRHFPSAVWWEQHYEHRVIFPEMVFAFDWLFLKGREILPLVLIALLDVAVWGMFVLSMRDPVRGRTPAMWSGLFLAGIVMSWPGVAFVLAFPFSLQFVMYQFAAVASFWSIATRHYRLAIALGILATFSCASGFFLWPLLVLIALAIGMSRRVLTEIAASGALAIGLFFFRYHNLGNTHPQVIVTHTAKFFGYFASYLGMPFGAVGTGTALGFGYGSLLLFPLLIVCAWRNKLLRRPDVLTPSALVLLTMATAFVTAMSRIPIDRPFAAAIVTPGRYVNFAAHYWAALILLSVAVFYETQKAWRWGAVIVFAFLTGTAFSRTGPWIHDWMNQYALFQAATIAIESGVNVDSAAQTLNYTDGGLVKRSLRELEQRQLSLYSDNDYRALGAQVDQLNGLTEISRSAITSVRPVPGGFEVVGQWASQPKRIIIVDGSGRVIGFGSHPGEGIPDPLPVPPGGQVEAFLAYAGPSFRPSDVRLFVAK